METDTLIGLGIIAAMVAVIGASIAAHSRKAAALRKRAEFIQRYAFPAELRNRLQSNTGLGLEQSGRVLEGLRQYFLACLAAQRKPIAKEVGMPSKAVDAAWHEFILLTKEYAKFCDQAFGKYLHHTPKAMMDTPTPAALANTLHQLRGQSLSPAGWAMVGSVPLLFALDRELGFKGGHVYEEGAMHELEGLRQAQLAAAGSGGSTSDSGSSSWTWSGGSESSGDSGGGGGDGGGGGGCGGSS
jgi:uncharacterized membrane protein YgcG